MHAAEGFLGADRHALVDELAAYADDVSASCTPRWVSIEANTGWGKTRLIQELYGRLAVQQPDPKYWPASVFPEDEATQRSSLRKQLHPTTFNVPDGAVPTWFWWAISCGSRSGSPFQALAEDIQQFRAHATALDRRWTSLAPPSRRVKRFWQRRGAELKEATLGEAAGAAAGYANYVLPGVGIAMLAVKWGITGLRGSGEDGFINLSADSRSDLLDELVPVLLDLALGGVPLIIVIEDLHDADKALVELLIRLLEASGAAILVISTAWPALLDEPSRTSSRLFDAVPDARVTRLKAGGRLRPMSPADLAGVARRCIPSIDDASAIAIAQRFDNPLAIELACNLDKVRRGLRSGPLGAGELDHLPRAIESLYEASWRELPEQLRLELAISSILSPSSVSSDIGLDDHRWDDTTVREVLDALPRLRDSLTLRSDLAAAGTIYSWVGHLDSWLRCFQEPGQRHVARSAAEDFISGNERRRIYEIAARQLEPGGGSPRSRHHARLIVALASEGFISWSEALEGAIQVVYELYVSQSTADAKLAIDICDNAIAGAVHHSDKAVQELHWARMLALQWVGRTEDALDEIRLVRRLYPPTTDAATVVQDCELAGLLAIAGRPVESIELLEPLLARLLRERDERDDLVLRVREGIHLWSRPAGQAGSLTASEDLVRDLSEVYGPADRRTLRARGEAAMVRAAVGDPHEAIAELEALLIGIAGSDPVSARNRLEARAMIGEILGKEGHYHRSCAFLDETIEEATSELGPDDILTLFLRLKALLYRDPNIARRPRTVPQSGPLAERMSAMADLMAEPPDPGDMAREYGDLLEAIRGSQGSDNTLAREVSRLQSIWRNRVES